MNIAEWGEFIALAVGGAFGLFCIFDGTRRAVVGVDARGGRLLALGLTIVGAIAAQAYYHHLAALEGARYFRDTEVSRELSADFGRKMSPARREATSQSAARSAYVGGGVIRQYVDITGQKKLFAPAQDDIKARDSVVAKGARLQQKADEDYREFVMWLVLGLCALLFGLGFGLEPAPRPKADGDEARVEPTMPVTVQGAMPAAAVAPAAAAAPAAPAAPVAAAAPPAAAKAPLPPKPAAPAAPVTPAKRIGEDTVPLPKPGIDTTVPNKPVGSDTVPMAKPAAPAGSTTVPLPKPNSVGSDTVPLPKPSGPPKKP